MEEKPDTARMSSKERRKKQYRDSKKKRRLEEKAKGVKEFSIKLNQYEAETLEYICESTDRSRNEVMKAVLQTAGDKFKKNGSGEFLVLLGCEESDFREDVIDRIGAVTFNSRGYILSDICAKSDLELVEFFKSHDISIRDLIISCIDPDESL